MTRILFIVNLNHNHNSLKNLLNDTVDRNITELYGSGNLPLGILSIDAFVKRSNDNIQTKIIDLNAEFLIKISKGDIYTQVRDIVDNFNQFLMNSIDDDIRNFEPDIIAISSLFDKSIPTLTLLSKIIKKIKEDILIIAGGHPANNLYKEILIDKECYIDSISLGEGEIPIRELVDAKYKKQYINNSPYFVTPEKIKENRFFQTTFVENLDDIPQYDYQAYFDKYGRDILCFHNNVLDSEHSFNKQAVIMTSRGCPYDCIFCASRQVHGNKMRKYSLERVKREIDYWIDVHQVSTIGIMDDHFLFDVERAIEICDYIGSKGVDIRFLNGLAIAPITREFVDALVRNNVKEVQLALESGSERVLREIIKKPLSLKKATEVSNLFKDTDIFIKIYLVVGFPEETLDDIEESLAYLRQAYFHWGLISIPTPISGSRLLTESLEKGFIHEYVYEQSSFYKSTFDKCDISEKMNQNIKYTVNLDINFVHNPYIRLGRYDLAKERFEAILKSYPEHAFALYFLNKCQKQLNEESGLTAQKYNYIISSNDEWMKYANYFNLDLVIK